jgi:hypothetical protein
MDEQERRETTEAEMDEQERREVEEAERLYAKAEKQYSEAVSAARQAGTTRREEEAEQRRAAEEEAEQQQANVAADAVRASYQAVADRSVSAQALNAQLTQQFFTDVINNLRTQTEDNRAMTQELVDQQRRTQEAGQALTQESVGAYMDFVNSIFSFYQGSVQEEDAEAAERGTTETGTSNGGERVESQEADGGGLPIEDYESLGVKKISERLEELSDEEVEQLRRYETANKNRSTLLARFDERLGASST